MYLVTFCGHSDSALVNVITLESSAREYLELFGFDGKILKSLCNSRNGKYIFITHRNEN